MYAVIPDYTGPGIYGIRNTRTNKLYIGSSTNIRRRLLEHRLALKAGTHQSKKLQYSFNKSGASAFEFVVLEEVAESDLVFAEQKHISQALADNRLYNTAKTASRTGTKHRKQEVIAEIEASLYSEAPVCKKKEKPVVAWVLKQAELGGFVALCGISLLLMLFASLKISRPLELIPLFFLTGFLTATVSRIRDRLDPAIVEHKQRLQYVAKHRTAKLQEKGLR